MTVSKLIKLLQAIQDKHGPRTQVSVAKDTLWDGNQCFTCCSIHDAVPKFVHLSDEHGGHAYTKAGFERGSVQAVIRGVDFHECPTEQEFQKSLKPKEPPPCQ